MEATGFAFAHPGVEVPALVIFARVRLAELIEVVQPLARFRRLGGSRLAAVRPLARLLARLEVKHVSLGGLFLGLGRLHADIGEAWLVLK